MGKVFGIDLGTTYSAIATINDQGMPEVIQNFADSTPTLASAVYFPEDGDPVIGKEAKNQRDVESDRVVEFIKRQIGKPNAVTRQFNGIDYNPIAISALILKRMKEYAEEQGYEVNQVVITCPAYFGTEERNATKQAGELVGLDVLNIVNEPTAAALNYGLRKFQEDRKILVFDLGGGTFDVSIVDFSTGPDGQPLLTVLETDGDDRLGGGDWDKKLMDYICECYMEENGLSKDELDAELKTRIRTQTEDIKKSLSNMPSKHITINYDGDSTGISVTREKFEELTADLVERTVSITGALLQKTGLTPDDIDTVLLVGGATMMPMIKNAVDKMFPGTGKVLREDPDLAVAKGASLAAAIEWNVIVDTITDTNTPDVPANPDPTMPEEDKKAAEKKQAMIEKYGTLTNESAVSVGGIVSGTKMTFQDILPSSFGPAIRYGDDLVVDNILFRGDNSPAEKTNRYYVPEDNSAGIRIMVYENNSKDKENHYLTPEIDLYGNPRDVDPSLDMKRIGEVTFDLPAGTPQGAPIDVTFNFSTSGLLVTAENVTTGEKFPVQILSENLLSDEEKKIMTGILANQKTSGQI